MSALLGRTGVYRDFQGQEWAAICVGEAYPGEAEAFNGQPCRVFCFPRIHGDRLTPGDEGGYVSCQLNLQRVLGFNMFTPHDPPEVINAR